MDNQQIIADLKRAKQMYSKEIYLCLVLREIGACTLTIKYVQNQLPRNRYGHLMTYAEKLMAEGKIDVDWHHEATWQEKRQLRLDWIEQMIAELSQPLNSGFVRS